jgi:pentatricopeptide repeat protein
MKENKLIPNDVTYGCLIDACIKNGNLQKALQVFKDMKKDKVKMNTIIYTTLIKGYAKEFMLDEALALYEEMISNQDIHPNTVTYNSLIDCSV